MYAVFDETLVTGNEMIDNQHKELIGKIAALEEACETNRDKATAMKLRSQLRRLVKRSIKSSKSKIAI